MKIYNLTITLVFCILTLFTSAQNKSINTENSSLSWTGKAAFNSYSLNGTLKIKNGIINIENDSIKILTITIDMENLNHENDDLKKHLRGKDFFEVKTYKTATFSLNKPVSINNGEATLRGEMRIKDITKMETFTIKLNTDYSNLSFDISIDRTAYGIKFNSPSFFEEMKENAIADEFKLKGNFKLE